MSWLASYRFQLAEEAAGRSHRFADILKYFRLFWLGSFALAGLFAGWMVWSEINNPYPGGGWGIYLAPFVALAIIVIGRVPYGIAQLFLSVKKHG